MRQTHFNILQFTCLAPIHEPGRDNGPIPRHGPGLQSASSSKLESFDKLHEDATELSSTSDLGRL